MEQKLEIRKFISLALNILRNRRVSIPEAREAPINLSYQCCSFCLEPLNNKSCNVFESDNCILRLRFPT